ncbi:NAD(P)H-binding protein [Kitasatospora sp. NPDC101183]|uniref:NAD(P)H-binding protein n=1 Tax=Kitasatospora sp. NPDC101183 TaxID=3364100 RepID=UPI003830B0BC
MSRTTIPREPREPGRPSRPRKYGLTTVVLGANGRIARHVATGLLAAGGPVRLASSDPARAQLLHGAEVVAADLARPETLPAALAGARRVFTYANAETAGAFAEAAKAAGVEHVVLLSSAAIVAPGAEANPVALQHRAAEEAIERAGLARTFVRPGMFATNTLWWWRDPIRAGRSVRLPYPDSESAPVHEADLAAIALAALTEPEPHAGQAYTVYGAESLTLRAQVAAIGAALGREVPVEVVTPEETRAELALTMPPLGVEIVMRQWAARDGVAAPVSATVAEVTGRPARTFADWARDHAEDFR